MDNFFSTPSGLEFKAMTLAGRPKGKLVLKKKNKAPWTESEKLETVKFIDERLALFSAIIRGIFQDQDWALWQNKMKFSASWFRNVRYNADALLRTEGILGLDGTRSKPKALARQKRIAAAIHQRCEQALRTKKNADRLGGEAVQLFAAFMAEPNRLRGAKQVQHTRQGGKARAAMSRPERECWRRQAVEIRKRRPGLSKNAIALCIDKARANTIRKVI